jgi:sugar phosphate permease
VELILMNLFPADAPIPILYAMFLIFAACSLAPGVMSITTTKELFPIEITGTSVGTVNLFPFVGGAVMQLVAGRTLDAYPKGVGDTYSLEAYSAMLGILLVAASIGLVCAFLMKETYSDQLRNPDVK